MALMTNKFGKSALASIGAVALAFPLYGAIAQEHDHSAHEGHGDAEAAEPLTAEQIEASRALFSTYGCGSCHLLADAGGTGHIGPSLDGNDTLSVEYVTGIINNGQGAMPSFGGMVSEEEIEQLSRYIVEVKQ